MSRIRVPPRLMAQAASSLNRELEADQSAVKSQLERAIALLNEFVRAPGNGFAQDLLDEYESALTQLGALGRNQPSRTGSVLAIGRRLRAASKRFKRLEERAGSSFDISASFADREPSSARSAALRPPFAGRVIRPVARRRRANPGLR